MALPRNTAEFRRQAPRYVAALMADFGLTDVQAAGFPGNFGVESAGFTKMQEIEPTAGRGGLGPGQWTGPRRRTYEAWLERKGAQPGVFETDYGYLFRELKGAEKGVLAPLRKATTVEQAVEIVMVKFERPGVPHLAKRKEWGRLALKTYREQPGAVTTLPPVVKSVEAPQMKRVEPQLTPTTWWQKLLRVKPPAAKMVGVNKGDIVLWQAQNQLLAAGYTGVGDPDGLWGKDTETSLGLALAEQAPGVVLDRYPLSDEVLAAVAKLERRKVAETRAGVTVGGLVKKGATVAKGAATTAGTGGLLTFLGLGEAATKYSGALDNVSRVSDQASGALMGVQSGIATISAVADFVITYRWLFLIVGGVFLLAKGFRWLVETRNLVRFGAIRQTTL